MGNGERKFPLATEPGQQERSKGPPAATGEESSWRVSRSASGFIVFAASRDWEALIPGKTAKVHAVWRL